MVILIIIGIVLAYGAAYVAACCTMNWDYVIGVVMSAPIVAIVIGILIGASFC